MPPLKAVRLALPLWASSCLPLVTLLVHRVGESSHFHAIRSRSRWLSTISCRAWAALNCTWPTWPGNLSARGQQVHVISTTPGPTEIDGLSVHRLCGPLLAALSDSCTVRRRSRELRALLERERYDVVHCHSSIVTPLSYGATWLARELQIPSVLTSHSLLGPHKPLFTLVNSLLAASSVGVRG